MVAKRDDILFAAAYQTAHGCKKLLALMEKPLLSVEFLLWEYELLHHRAAPGRTYHLRITGEVAFCNFRLKRFPFT